MTRELKFKLLCRVISECDTYEDLMNIRYARLPALGIDRIKQVQQAFMDRKRLFNRRLYLGEDYE